MPRDRRVRSSRAEKADLCGESWGLRAARERARASQGAQHFEDVFLVLVGEIEKHLPQNGVVVRGFIATQVETEQLPREALLELFAAREAFERSNRGAGLERRTVNEVDRDARIDGHALVAGSKATDRVVVLQHEPEGIDVVVAAGAGGAAGAALHALSLARSARDGERGIDSGWGIAQG